MSEARGWFESLSQPAAFRADARYALCPDPMGSEPPGHPDTSEPEPVCEEIPDPAAQAYLNGFDAGLQQVRAEFAASLEAHKAALAALRLSFGRLDHSLNDDLRERLRDTVEALCETALAPLTMDGDMLARRIEVALSMLSRADDERVIRLHPDDVPLVTGIVPAEWTIEPDPFLERGALRVEAQTGGVEDGPATWRRAICEALDAC